jgi:hypothetical protein
VQSFGNLSEASYASVGEVDDRAEAALKDAKARSVVHWSPHDRVGVVNAVP